MGISGLLPLLKSIHKPCNLKQFAGQTIGVDAYGWLHRGTVACATELALDKPTTKFVDFAMSRVRMLKHFGITPYIVFDGDYLPSKSKTEKERAARRKESKRLGMQLLELGKTSQAYLELQKAVDVTPEMAGQLIAELKHANIQYVVAPYEADSQLAYLEQKGIINGILSEDSDLLVFGAKRLLTKLNQYGDCILIRRDDFTACKEVSLVGWSDQEFRKMAIMSGCDYLTNIEKMGLKTAHRLIRKHKTMDRVIRAVQFDGKFKVPPNYLEAFHQAEMTFLHQWVFCPGQQCLVHCTPLEEGLEACGLPYIGAFVEPAVAGAVARGELHPHTKEPLQITVAPRKRMYPPHNRQAAVATPDLKKNKTLDSFFQTKRTPLAELDPNSFTGSPSQQSLARRASGTSWPATPVTTPGIQGTSVRGAMVSTSVPNIARRTVSDIATPRSHSDRVPKRRRLCSDGSSPVAAQNADRVESGRSKFFAPPEDAVSPSKRATQSRTSSKKNMDIEVFSDASLEEALLDLPEHSVYMAKSKKIQIFEDGSNLLEKTTPMKDLPDQDTSQETNTSTETALFSQEKKGDNSTPPSSIESSKSTRKTIFAKHSLAEVRSLTKFSYHARSNHISSRTSLSRTKSAPSRRLTSFGSSKLQIGPDALPASRSVKTPSLADMLPQTLDHSGKETLDVADDMPDIEDAAFLDHVDDDVVVPASDGMVVPDSPHQAVMKNGPDHGISHGSEDLLVSESEAEEGEGTPKAKSVFDVGKFMFVGG
ncbi:hypothetical protein EJ08DRAFT_606859 [Tothia fuscella]|uniref:Exonuclease 1 n=1 Tax=Tothia fuscella TaxID=1048955 RepID=A0A9P4NXZ3_9PEZI|nr:hypothetical protein EJ08DRAFT_606859 [Tothia fuscella]